MGKMKEIFTEIIENEYRGDYSAYIQDLARQTCEEYVHMGETVCPNCLDTSLYQNESDIKCDVCAQHFVQIDNALRFK